MQRPSLLALAAGAWVAGSLLRPFVPMTVAASPPLAGVFGLYELGPDRRLWIGPFPELDPDPFFLDFASGRFGPLRPGADGALLSGPDLQSADPVEISLTVERDAGGTPRRIAARLGEAPAVTGRRSRSPARR